MAIIQHLPETIISRIIYFINDLPIYHNQSLSSLLPLLNISAKWRIEVQLVIFAQIKLRLVGNIPRHNLSSLLHYEYSKLHKSKYLMGLVESVELDVTDREIITGEYLSQRSRIPECQLVLPHAHILHITVDRDMEYETDFSDYSDSPYDKITLFDYEHPYEIVSDWGYTNVVNFVSYLKQTLPNLQNVSISLGKIQTRWLSCLENIAHPLFKLYNTAGVSSLFIYHRSYEWNIQCPLVHLDIAYYEELNNAKEIIMRNASTLQSLVVYSNFKYQTCIWEILGAQELIVYPHLQKLTLRQQGNTRAVDELDIDPNYIPFPNLCQLITDPTHAIKDDIFFRGNEDKLEFIDISVNIDVAKVIKDILTRNSLTRLRKVCLKVLLNKHPYYYFKSENDILNLLKYLPNWICILDIKCDEFQIKSEFIATMANLTHLQVLNLESSKSSMDKIFSLIEKLHWIRKLSVYQCDIDDHYKTMSALDVTNVIQSKFDLSECKLKNVDLSQSSFSMNSGDDISRSIAMFEVVLLCLFPQGIRLNYSSIFDKNVIKWKLYYIEGGEY